MKKEEEHMLYYISLVGILILGVFLIYSFSANQSLQMVTIIGMAICYVLLGILHHLLNHDLILKIVIEYVLIAMLGIAVAFFIFKGGFGL